LWNDSCVNLLRRRQVAHPLTTWNSLERVMENGSVESVQKVTVSSRVVPLTGTGALLLGNLYWSELERATSGLFRVVQTDEELALCFLGRGAALLRFGRPVVEVGPESVVCCYPIRGGLLARRAAGEFSFVQRDAGESVELISCFAEFIPRLGGRPGWPRWSGAVYTLAEAPFHAALSRRYFARLLEVAR
jgi:hypothetical protein